MHPNKRLALNNKLTYLVIGVLFSCFLLAFFLALVPELPDFPSSLDTWPWFVCAWNLAGPMMFVVVFRIHTLRELHRVVQRQDPIVGVTPWVRFWFGAAIIFGLATIVGLLWTYLGGQGAQVPLSASILALAPIIAWVMLISLSLSLFRMRRKYPESIRVHLERARRIHEWLLVPSSLVFFIFTGLYSFVILVS